MRKFVHQKLVLLTSFLAVAVCSYSQTTSNKGREFWVGYGHHQFMEQGNNAMNMRIYLSTEEQAATVTITIDSSGNPFLPVNTIGGIWRKTYNIPPFTAIQSDIIPKGPTNVAAAPGDVPSDAFWDARLYDIPPQSGGTGGSGVFRGKGIHIESNVPITAYAHIYGSASSGATMLIPVTAWGYEYVSLNSNQSYANDCYSWAYIIASKDNTVLEITPSVKTRAQNMTGLAPNVTTTVTLMKGQIYQLIGANTASDANGNVVGGAATGYELSGTRGRSVAGAGGECYPIAVFAGSSRTSNPASCGTGGGDNDNQQLFPMHSWGKKYLTAPFSPSTNPAGAQRNIIKIAFDQPPPATTVRRNGAVLPIPAGSKFYTYETTTADYIESDKPIMINQFMNGAATCLNGGVGDPEMVVVSPVEQAIKGVTFYRQSRQNITTNYLTLIVPTAGLPSLRIDNSAAFDHTYPHPQNGTIGKNYTVVVKRWTIGAGQGFQCNVKCDSAFNAITYGLGSVESYAYSAGAYINNLNALTGLHNQPDTSNSGDNINEFTGVGTPIDLSILILYKPDRLTWKFSEMTPSTPAGCLSSNPPVVGDYVMNPALPFLTDSIIIDGKKYYKYTLPQTFTFNCVGVYEIPVEAYSPGINNCGNRETFYLSIEVKAKPITNYTYQHPTRCTKDTLYLTGQTSALSGIQPMVLNQWKWLLPGGITGTKKDTAVVLPPGTHTIKLVAVTDEGLLTDTVSKTITVFPPPSLLFTANPDTVCMGQSITFNQTATYGDPAIPITNYYWNFGDNTTSNGLTTTMVHTYAGPGTYTATAAVKVSNLCVSDTAQAIVVVSSEAVLNLSYPAGCLSSSGLAQFNAGATDASGSALVSYSWNFGDPGSGANNTSTLQNPTHTYATPGTYQVNLVAVNSTGCTGDTTVTLAFGVQPSLSYLPLGPVCANASSIQVNSATVTNGVAGTGVYSGPGITNAANGTFNPALAGPGNHTITYTYTTTASGSVPSCSQTITSQITVNAPPVLNAGTYPAVCINAVPVALSGTPAGGSFSGPGVTSNSFNPATAGVGTHTITYTYTDANSCTNTATTTITVNALPVVNAGTYAPLCINAAAITLNGTPLGSGFSGPGVTGNSFNPATAGAGTHTITFTYTDVNGCTNTANTTITVNPLPVVNAGTYAAVCVNATAVPLNGTPAGGTFSGPGVTGTSFNPATAGVGTHTITYNYTNANGCANSATTSITVNALPIVNAGTYTPVCANATAVALSGTPVGGTFSGPGVTGTSFNPATAGAGTHTITYNYTNANGCVNSATTTVTVNALPVVNAGTYTPVCINATAVTLNGTPAAGTFSGPGVTGTSFSPATAGVGTHTITYNYTDANGCANSATTTIIVNALPVVNAGTYAAVCLNAAAVTLNGTPAGGTFSGPGVTGTSFNAATAGVGTHTITYNYTDANGCANSATTTITVNALPVVNAGTYAALCINAAAFTLTGTPAGGSFSGTGVTGNSFNPATAGIGTHTITYTYTDANSCVNSATTTVTVYNLPTVNAGTYTAVCIDGAAVALNGTPAGGSFSGPGVTGNSFSPATAGAGTHTINYNYTDAGGCSNSTTTTITVNPLPVLNAGTYSPVCINGAAITLAGTPVGGTFSGPGVTGNSFNPATAGAGTHTITYGGVSGCNNTITTTITVNPLPVVNAGTYSPVCINGAAVTLAGTPTGGTFSGAGVTGNSFNPATAGVGTHTITYNYTNANGCSNSTSTTITVNALPVVNAGTYSAVCSDASPLTLAGTPAGGTFSGPGVTGTSFNPNTAGIGTHTVTYVYIDVNGCSNSATTTITVNAVPTAAAGVYPAICFEAAPITLNGAPNGGTFSGPGVTGNTFNPSLAGAGTHNIVYSYTSPAGCSQTNTTTVLVHPRPTSSFTATNSICLDGTSTLTSSSSISSGSIASWNWDLGNGSTPSYTNGNPFAVSYTSSNAYTVQLITVSDMGCVSLPATQTINVHPLPITNFNLPTGICMPGGNAAFTNQTTVSDNSALSYQWNFGDGNSSVATSPTHIYAASGNYNVSLVATSAFGCVSQVSKTLNSFYDKPIADFTVNPQQVCQGLDNNFTSTSTAPNSTIQSWNWNFNDGSTSTTANPVKKFTTPGVYNVQLTVTNAVGCVSDPYVLPVTVHLQPKIDAGPSFVVPMGTQIQFGATANSAGLTFSWSPPIGLSDAAALKPALTANLDQVYTLTATGSNGCTATDFLSVKILKPIQVPNIFTPNGDNIHDRWVIPNISDYPGASVEVFNRYGQQVFFSVGYATPWDGRFKGKDLPTGTYYYVIKLNNGFKMVNGSVTIVR